MTVGREGLFPSIAALTVRKQCAAVALCLQELNALGNVLPGLTMGVDCSRWYLREREREKKKKKEERE